MNQIKLVVALSLLKCCIACAQTPTITWWYDTHDASFGQSAAGDIDGDGLYEVVFGCYRNDSSVYALNAENGTLLWKFNTHPEGAEGCNDVAPAIFDIDNNGQPEVILPSSCNPVTYCFDGLSGDVVWQCNTLGSDSPPTIADIDNDANAEILHGEFGGLVKCIRAENGTEQWEIPVDVNSWIQTAPTIVDLDNNNQLDFVVGTWNFNGQDSIYAYRGDNQTRLWTYPVHDVMYHGTAVADLDNDNYPELLIGSYNDTLYCINGENGTTHWKYKASGGYIGSPASLADIDNDGSCDVVFTSAYQVIALSHNGLLKWQYDIPAYAQSFRGVAIADITNDQYPDIIFGTDAGKLMALHGNDGSLIWSIDLADHYGDENFALDHAPLVADFDNDDTLDVFIVGGHAEYPAFENNFGRAYMISAGVGNGPDWLMFQHDLYRQSSLCIAETSAIDESNTSPNLNIFPNPAQTHITLDLQPMGNSIVEISNVFGATVLQSSFNQSGVIDISQLSPGVYFLHVRTGNSCLQAVKFVKQ